VKTILSLSILVAVPLVTLADLAPDPGDIRDNAKIRARAQENQSRQQQAIAAEKEENRAQWLWGFGIAGAVLLPAGIWYYRAKKGRGLP
jgi:hypothetical protein